MKESKSSKASERRAVLLAGGYGKRLAPFTIVIPKPIVPIGTTPIVEIVLRQLAAYGFTRVTIALGHMSDLVRAVVSNGTKFGISVDFTREEKPLGTMGPLHLIPDLPDNFLVMNSDLLTDLNFNDFWKYHVRSSGLATIGTYVKETKLELGILETDGDKVKGFSEKPTLRNKVSMGIYIFRRDILNYVPKDAYFGFDHLMNALISRNCEINSYLFGGRWLDIGIPSDYEKAQEEFQKNQRIYIPSRKAAK
jgi:NDP-mannose synthase